MEQLLERTAIETAEKEKHNATISERYRKLLDAVEDQFSAPVVEAQTAYDQVLSEISTMEETPVTEQNPTVSEYKPSELASSVFTTERFERLQEAAREVRPVETQSKAVVKATPTAVAHYTLTPLAKLAMAVFTLIVIAMLTLIGVNSHALQRRSVRLKNLEEKKERLMEEYEELEAYLAELQTPENIIERGTEAGYIG